MKVTKITQQKKINDRYSVYIDDVYRFSLSEYQLVGSGIRVGKEYSQQEIEQLIDDSQFGKMYERSLNYVMVRPRSHKELTDYLKRKYLYPKAKAYRTKAGEMKLKKVDVDKERVAQLVDRVITRLEEKGYIDDEAFAKAWVRSRLEIKKASIKKIRYELVQKGVHSSIIEVVLSDLDDEETENLKAVIVKKRKLAKYQDNTKLIQYLMRQGFKYDDIKKEIDGIS